MTEASEDVNLTSSYQTFVNFINPEITITYEYPNHQPSTSVDDTEAMESQDTVIT